LFAVVLRLFILVDWDAVGGFGVFVGAMFLGWLVFS